MDYSKKTLKRYQTIKINSYIKKNTFLFFFLTNKSKSTRWKKNEQTLKKLKLNYYKTTNQIVLKKFKNSVFKNFTALISGIILLISFNLKNFEKFGTIQNLLSNDFVFMCLKLNNKIYPVNEVEKISNFSYNNEFFVFYKFLEKYSKINYIFFYDNNSK